MHFHLSSDQFTDPVIYHIVHVYQVVHYCDRVSPFMSRSESMEICCYAFFLYINLYLHCRWRSNYQEGGGVSINRINTTTFVCQSQPRTWIFKVTCHCLFMFDSRGLEAVIRIVDIVTLLTVSV